VLGFLGIFHLSRVKGMVVFFHVMSKDLLPPFLDSALAVVAPDSLE
jgi:hypothetical protein